LRANRQYRSEIPDLPETWLVGFDILIRLSQDIFCGRKSKEEIISAGTDDYKDGGLNKTAEKNHKPAKSEARKSLACG